MDNITLNTGIIYEELKSYPQLGRLSNYRSRQQPILTLIKNKMFFEKHKFYSLNISHILWLMLTNDKFISIFFLLLANILFFHYLLFI